MTIQEMQSEILRLKKEKSLCILAHTYQRREITEIADFTGDSYALAKWAAETGCDTILLCGVRFMAETAKILSPDKRVLLVNPAAGCPMAEQMDKELIEQLKGKYPGYAVAAYVNTTARLKTICDVCVTSSSAVRILSALPERDILFIPDVNLGTYVREQLPKKNIRLVHGGCPTHVRASAEDVRRERSLHPQALLLVHPECVPEVVRLADYVGSTSGIMAYAGKSAAREFIIGTENTVVEHLQYDYPNKRFYPLSKDLVCHNMRITTLRDLLACCAGQGGEEIVLDAETLRAARRCLDRMIAYGG